MTIIYASSAGSGSKSGSSVSNALPVTSLDKAIQLAGTGGTVKMLADQGAYTISSGIPIAHGGSSRAPVKIIGVDSAGHEMNIQVNGARPAGYTAGMEAGNETFKLLAGANNLIFENMSFANVGTAFRAGADVRNIVIQDMAADNVGRFFEDYLSGTNASASVTGLTIRNVEVHGFSDNVIRLQYDAHNVLIENVWGDSERQQGDDIAIGIHLDGTVHDVVIRNTTMMNAQSRVSDYWNGDGFATERGVYNVTFENTTAIGNADGGYDLKSTNTTLINAIAEDNGRNFRLWGDATLTNPTGIDPHKWGGSIGGQFQIQIMSGAEVTVTGGEFADSGTATAVVANEGGSVTFNGTSFIHATGGRLTTGTGTFGIDNALVKAVSATGVYSTNGESLIGPEPSVKPCTRNPVRDSRRARGRMGRQIGRGDGEHATQRFGFRDLQRCRSVRSAQRVHQTQRVGLCRNVVAEHGGDRHSRHGGVVILGAGQRARLHERRPEQDTALRYRDQ